MAEPLFTFCLFGMRSAPRIDFLNLLYRDVKRKKIKEGVTTAKIASTSGHPFPSI